MKYTEKEIDDMIKELRAHCNRQRALHEIGLNRKNRALAILETELTDTSGMTYSKTGEYEAKVVPSNTFMFF